MFSAPLSGSLNCSHLQYILIGGVLLGRLGSTEPTTEKNEKYIISAFIEFTVGGVSWVSNIKQINTCTTDYLFRIEWRFVKNR